MKINEIIELIKDLAQGQGMYGRLYETLMEIKNTDKAEWESVVEELEKQNFQSSLDFILWFEG